MKIWWLMLLLVIVAIIGSGLMWYLERDHGKFQVKSEIPGYKLEIKREDDLQLMAQEFGVFEEGGVLLPANGSKDSEVATVKKVRITLLREPTEFTRTLVDVNKKRTGGTVVHLDEGLSVMEIGVWFEEDRLEQLTRERSLGRYLSLEVAYGLLRATANKRNLSLDTFNKIMAKKDAELYLNNRLSLINVDKI